MMQQFIFRDALPLPRPLRAPHPVGEDRDVLGRGVPGGHPAHLVTGRSQSQKKHQARRSSITSAGDRETRC